MAIFDTTWYLNYGDGSTTGYYAVAQWATGTAYTVGQLVRQLAAPTVNNERIFVCIVAGTSHATTEPTWVLTYGAKTTDNTVTWMEVTGRAGVNGDTTNAGTWTASRAYVLGQMIYDNATSSIQIITTAGTSKTAPQPSFSATAGTTTADNTATWTSLGLASGFSAWGAPHARKISVAGSGFMIAGNTCYVANTHAETQAAAMTSQHGNGTGAAPLIFLCTSTATAPPTSTTTGATISTTGNNAITLQGFFYDNGITYSCGDGATQPALNLGSSGGGVNLGYLSENCTYKLGATGAGSFLFGVGGANSSKIDNATWVFGNTASQILVQSASIALLTNSTFAATGSVPSTIFKVVADGGGARNAGLLVIRDSDISSITGTLVNFNSGAGGNATGNTIIENCKLGAGVTISSNTTFPASTLTGYVKVHNCDSSATNYRYYYGAYGGTIQQETTIVRTGSLATDGTTPISWQLVSSANTGFVSPFISEEISIWNNTTNSVVTATFYLISNTTLNNNDFWAEAEYLSSSSSPLGAFVNSRMAWFGTPSSLTSDTSTWGGSTNKYKIVLTFTPQMKGPIKARFYAAKATATTYIDPYIYLS